MSTFRIARHAVDMDTGDVGVDRRAVVVVFLLCVALFAGCYAIGRASSPRGRPAARSYTSLPVAFAGAAVPFHLSSAPAIRIRTPARKRRISPAPQSKPAGVTVTPATAPSPTPEAPSVQSPVREVARAPAPVRSTPTPTPAPASARGGERGGSKSHTNSGSGTSFDSSG